KEDQLSEVDDARVSHHEIPAGHNHAPDEAEDQNVEKIALPNEGAEGQQGNEADPEIILVRCLALGPRRLHLEYLFSFYRPSVRTPSNPCGRTIRTTNRVRSQIGMVQVAPISKITNDSMMARMNAA